MLVEMAKRGKCVAFVGAGLSQGADAPSWEGLMTGLIDFAISEGKLDRTQKRAMVRALRSRGSETVADALKSAVGESRFNDFVDGKLRGLSPRPVHSVLVGQPCPFRAVFTTNYDCLIEKAYRKAHPNEDLRVVTHDDIAEAARADRSNEFYVMKLHGCITRGNLVLTRPEFIELQRSQDYMDFVMGQLVHNTFLFIGHSLSDDDTRRFLEHLASGSPSRDAVHFCLIRRGELQPLVRDRLAGLYKLQFVEYEQHADILLFLQDLARLARTAPPSCPSDILSGLILALGWILDERRDSDGVEVLLARRPEGGSISGVALTALPGDATEERIAKAKRAAASFKRESTFVILVPQDQRE